MFPFHQCWNYAMTQYSANSSHSSEVYSVSFMTEAVNIPLNSSRSDAFLQPSTVWNSRTYTIESH